MNLATVLDGTALDDRIGLRVTKSDGSVTEIECRHTLSRDQIEWLRAGSALNWIAEEARRRVL